MFQIIFVPTEDAENDIKFPRPFFQLCAEILAILIRNDKNKEIRIDLVKKKNINFNNVLITSDGSPESLKEIF